MTPDQKQLVIDLVSDKISNEAFLLSFPGAERDGSALSLRLLRDAYQTEDADDLDHALLVGFQFGFTQDHLDLLCRLADARWHFKHEDVVTALEQLRDERAVEPLFRSALARHEYLDYDDSRALAVKAIWALGKIGSPAAVGRLRELAQSGEPVVSDTASDQLRRQARHRAG